MTTEQIDRIILANASKIDLDRGEAIRQQLVAVDEGDARQAFDLLKSPTTVLLVSIFLGSLGIDRFILGQKFLGVLKLVTGGGCFIWTIIDWFTSGDRTRAFNTRLLLSRLDMLREAASTADADGDATPAAPSADIAAAPSADF